MAEIKGRALVAPEKESKIQDWRHTLLVKLARFRTLQAMFMPGATRIISEEEAARDSDAPPPKPENIKLWMPHELDDDDRAAGCVRGLTGIEARLRHSQCLNALVVMRSQLHTKRHLLTFRDDNVTSQKGKMKAYTLIEQLGERVDASAGKYRKGYEALVRLQGDTVDRQFRPLKEEDIRLDGDHDQSDLAARKKLAMLSSGRGARAPRNALGTSKRVMSWIWTAQGGAVDGEEHLHDCKFPLLSGILRLKHSAISSTCGMVPSACAEEAVGGRGFAD